MAAGSRPSTSTSPARTPTSRPSASCTVDAGRRRVDPGARAGAARAAEAFEAFRCAEERDDRARRASSARAAERGLQPLRWPDPFPFDSALAMRAATYAKQIGRAVAVRAGGLPPGVRGRARARRADNVLIAAAACEMHPAAVLKARRAALGRATRSRARPRRRPRAACATCRRSLSAGEVFHGDDAARRRRRRWPRGMRRAPRRYRSCTAAAAARPPAARRSARPGRGRRHRRRRDRALLGPARRRAARARAACARTSSTLDGRGVPRALGAGAGRGTCERVARAACAAAPRPARRRGAGIASAAVTRVVDRDPLRGGPPSAPSVPRAGRGVADEAQPRRRGLARPSAAVTAPVGTSRWHDERLRPRRPRRGDDRARLDRRRPRSRTPLSSASTPATTGDAAVLIAGVVHCASTIGGASPGRGRRRARRAAVAARRPARPRGGRMLMARTATTGGGRRPPPAGPRRGVLTADAATRARSAPSEQRDDEARRSPPARPRDAPRAQRRPDLAAAVAERAHPWRQLDRADPPRHRPRPRRRRPAGTGTTPAGRAAPRAPSRTSPCPGPRRPDVRGPLVPPLGGAARSAHARRAGRSISTRSGASIEPSGRAPPPDHRSPRYRRGRWPTTRSPSPTSRASGSRRCCSSAASRSARARCTPRRRSAASCTSRSARRRRSSASARAMRDADYLISTYRSHGHALARGTEPERVMAELFGREGGCCRGRGGSMHMFDLERRFMGGYGIVGGNLPIAAGFGLAADYPAPRTRRSASSATAPPTRARSARR